MPTVLAIASTKGGVTKTTTTANLGGILADFGMRVLLMDADLQPSLTRYYPIVERAPHGLSRVLKSGGYITQDCISQTAIPGLDIIYSDAEEADLQTWLRTRTDQLLILRRAVRRSPVLDRYHVVLIDTQGAKGELLNCAAMAADTILSPIKPGILSVAEFTAGTLAMLETLNSMADFGPDIRSGDLLVLISDIERTNNSRELAAHIRREFIGYKNVKGVLSTAIPHAAAYDAASTEQVPVHRYDKRKGVAKSAYEVMHRLAWEIFPELEGIYVDTVRADETRQGGVRA